MVNHEDFSHPDQRGRSELVALINFALDVLADIQHCVQALPLDEGDSLTIQEVIEESMEALKDYYEVILARRNTNDGL